MLSKLPKYVRIVEVGARDGLQNEKTFVSTEDKHQFIKMLYESGISELEASSFVRSEKIPQMSDSEDLFRQLKNDSYFNDKKLIALVPNIKGMEKAIELGVKEIAVFTSTSESFNQRNINSSIEESLNRIKEVCSLASKHDVRIRGYVSTAFGCPYEGETSVEKLEELILTLLSYGAYEVSIGDTIGVANPLQVSEVLEKILTNIDKNEICMHFHDTRGMALANILTSLEYGITNFDSSAAGLGGCPYAKGASGNVATEDVVHMLHSMNIETNIDFHKLYLASKFILSKLNKNSISKAYLAYEAKQSDK